MNLLFKTLLKLGKLMSKKVIKFIFWFTYIIYLIISILYGNVNRVNRFSYIEEKSLGKYGKIIYTLDTGIFPYFPMSFYTL